MCIIRFQNICNTRYYVLLWWYVILGYDLFNKGTMPIQFCSLHFDTLEFLLP